MNLTILMRKPDEKALQREGVVQLDLSGALQIGPSAQALTNTFEVIIGKYDHIPDPALGSSCDVRHLPLLSVLFRAISQRHQHKRIVSLGEFVAAPVSDQREKQPSVNMTPLWH